ncbi:MAG: squalene/phytoene synthase family protein [Proteobacteria bacterium]|nr:squalene/phytoene synthase family protein [Pseudomonadota bacterium]
MTPESNSARYFSVLYAATAERPALEALLGIEREVSDSLRPGLDHHVAHSRLQWWREECERATRGGAVHPLTRALIAALGDPQAKSVPQLAGLCGIVDVAIWDLASATFETRKELEAYCQRWAGAVVEPLVAVATTGAAVSGGSTAGAAPADDLRAAREDGGAAPAGDLRAARGHGGAAPAGDLRAARGHGGAAPAAASPERNADWHALGAAICEIELLADLRRDALHGRIRLPLNELESAKVDTRALAKPPWPDAVASLIRDRLAALRKNIVLSVESSSREQQRALRGLLVWAALTWRTAQRIEQSLPSQLQPARFDGISDAWFAWRIARRATVGRFRLN